MQITEEDKSARHSNSFDQFFLCCLHCVQLTMLSFVYNHLLLESCFYLFQYSCIFAFRMLRKLWSLLLKIKSIFNQKKIKWWHWLEVRRKINSGSQTQVVDRFSFPVNRRELWGSFYRGSMVQGECRHLKFNWNFWAGAWKLVLSKK